MFLSLVSKFIPLEKCAFLLTGEKFYRHYIFTKVAFTYRKEFYTSSVSMISKKLRDIVLRNMTMTKI